MAISMGEAARLRREWGDKPCDHPDYEHERADVGPQTGDIVCTQCGDTFWNGSAEAKAMIARHRAKQK